MKNKIPHFPNTYPEHCLGRTTLRPPLALAPRPQVGLFARYTPAASLRDPADSDNSPPPPIPAAPAPGPLRGRPPSARNTPHPPPPGQARTPLLALPAAPGETP